MQRLETKGAKDSNPKCDVDITVHQYKPNVTVVSPKPRPVGVIAIACPGVGFGMVQQGQELACCLSDNPRIRSLCVDPDCYPERCAAQVPEIELEFRNGDKHKILPDAKMKIQDIEKIITSVSTRLELKEQIAEMKAAPVTGPVRTPCPRPTPMHFITEC